MLMDGLETEHLAGLVYASGDTATNFWAPKLKIKLQSAWGRHNLLTVEDAKRVAAAMRANQQAHDEQHARWDAAREKVQRERRELRLEDARKAREERRKAEEAADQKRIEALRKRDADAAIAVAEEQAKNNGPSFASFAKAK
jgi:hypothetical protein